MTLELAIGLLPLIVLAVDCIAVLIASAFERGTNLSFVLTFVGLAAALVAAAVAWPRLPFAAGAFLSFDGFVLFGIVLILAATLFVAAMSRAYLQGEDRKGEYYFLLLVSTLGACVLAAAGSFAALFLGLETLSVALYALIGWRRDRGVGTEAAIKYLILAGASSAFLLFGMALVYASTGTMELARLARAATSPDFIAPVGLGMMIVGIGFKLAVVPFHLWTPDVYDGAPAPVTGYVASVSKGAMLVVLARALSAAFLGPGNGAAVDGSAPLAIAFPWVFAVISGASMFAGNILALREANVKRILAYSSIAHLGYMLFAFLAAGPQALRAIAFYLVAYFAMTLGAFATVSALSTKGNEADDIAQYRGLASRHPWLAAVFTVMLLSLAGLPLTAGFIGKFIILTAGAGAELWTLAVILAVNTTISIFYYLRIVSAMFRPAEAQAGVVQGPGDAAGGPALPPALVVARTPFLAALAIALLTLAVVALGVYPSPVLSFIGTFTTAGF